MKQSKDFAKAYVEQQEATKWPTEKPHPMRKIAGLSKSRARWDRYIGRWVIDRLT